MTDKTIAAAVAEAERFLTAVKNYREAPQQKIHYSRNAESGAVRRASMDLTRALAVLRRYD